MLHLLPTGLGDGPGGRLLAPATSCGLASTLSGKLPLLELQALSEQESGADSAQPWGTVSCKNARPYQEDSLLVASGTGSSSDGTPLIAAVFDGHGEAG